MISKKDIENFLRINNIPLNTPDLGIKKALIEANWDPRDIDEAVSVLRDRVYVHQQNQEDAKRSAEKLLFSDASIAPDSLSAMLGIDIELTNSRIRARSLEKKEMETAAADQYGFHMTVLSILVGVGFAMGGLLAYMYIYEVGIFYTPIEQFEF